MAEEPKEKEGDKKIVHTYPLVRNSDMNEDVKGEIVEIIVTACEKHPNNNEAAAKVIKETMDKKFGISWHIVIGEAFGFEITYECKNLLYMYFAGNLAIVAWKCS